MSALAKVRCWQLASSQLGVVALLGVCLALGRTVKAREGRGAQWLSVEIGQASASEPLQADSAGDSAVTSAGADIYGLADAFHYVYRPLGANGQLVARVQSIQGANDYIKAGVMVRETLAANSRNAMMLVTAGHGVSFQWRFVTGGKTQHTVGSTNVLAPCWLKIVRSGEWVGGYSSVDGVNWALVGWATFRDLALEAYVGLAVTAHNFQGSPATAIFSNLSAGAADSAAVLNPVIGTGTGLLASYYDNRHLYGPPVTNRVEANVDVNFATALLKVEPQALRQAQCRTLLGMYKEREFGVCWSGELEAQFTEPYMLYMRSSDGARVWLNEQLLIDDWRCHAFKESSATVDLVAGQRYLLRVEYFRNRGGAQAQLSWSSPSTPKQLVPQNQLYWPPAMDTNGLPILWEEHYFGRRGVDAQADPDGDGLSNLQEYEFHSNPTEPQSWGVPDSWAQGDVGDWSTAGQAGYSNGVFQVSSVGDNIGEKEDSFYFVYQALGTNGTLVARFLGLQATNECAKAGLMVRETLDRGARNAMILVTRTNSLSFQWRQTAGGRTQQPRFLEREGPHWLKVVRSGDWVGGYTSADGANWTLVDWATWKGLAPRVFVGLAVSAHLGSRQQGSPAVAKFEEVNLGPADPAKVMELAEGSGNGLRANFRNDSLLYLPGIATRVDHEVDCNWPHESPMNNRFNPDSWGVCWSGEIEAQFSEPYTFSLETRPEDWVRLWINERLMVDGWRVWHSDAPLRGTVSLEAGQRYLIRVEMFNHLGRGKAILRWGCPSMSERVVPQSQLYAEPLDSDGNGLPDAWEQVYFGHIGVDANADPDGDGLSNLQEYRYHTNPLKADTDNDGMPDAWEVAHGLDPQFDDAAFDYSHSGLSNLEIFAKGLDPFNPDTNGDGLPDSFEEQYLGTGRSFVCTNQISVAALIHGVQATNFLGRWQVEGNDIYCLDRRGGLDFILPVSSPDKYVLNLVGTQSQGNGFETRFKLLLGIDGQSLGNYVLTGGYGTNGVVELVLPYLQAGSHALRVFWDGVAGSSSLRIKQVKLLSISGPAGQNGIKHWAARMMAAESGLDNTNAVIGSYTSPLCLEGRDPYPAMMQLAHRTNALLPTATTDGRWYVNVPLSARAQTVFQAYYQNGGLAQTRRLQWLPVNILTATNLTIRQGDRLLLCALPDGATDGSVQISAGTNSYSGSATEPFACRFSTPGPCTVSSTYIAPSGVVQNGRITVNVVEQKLPDVEPVAWTDMQRPLNVPALAPEAVLQADSRLSCSIAGTNANDVLHLALVTDANERRSVLARLGAHGPVLDSTQVRGFDLWSGAAGGTTVLQVYPDGSQLVQTLLVWSPIETNVTFALEPIVSGVIFEDGTLSKTLTAADFDALGQCMVRFIRPASATTSVCHSIRAYQGKYLIGYRH